MVANNRGQVLLLGGLAIAIVFLTAIPLSNSLVVTESASTSDTPGDIDSAAQREANIERGLRILVNGTSNRTRPALNQSVENFTTYYTRVDAQQDGVYVDVTLNVAETEGNITRQTSNTDFQKPDQGPGPNPGNNDWDLARDADEIAIFEITITDSIGGGMNAFHVEVTGDSGVTRELSAVPAGSETEIRVGGTPICSGPSVTVDLVQGECDGATTGSFSPITAGLDEPYTVTFRNGNKVDGNYTFASTGRFPDDSYDQTPPDKDYRAYGIRPAFDVRYVGPDASYTETIVVNETT